MNQTNLNFYVLEDGTTYAKKSLIGETVRVDCQIITDPEKPVPLTLSECYNELIANETRYEEALQKIELVGNCNKYVYPQIENSLSQFTNYNNNPEISINSSSSVRKLGKAGSKIYVLPKSACSVHYIFLYANEIVQEEREEPPFWHPNADWFMDDYGFGVFEVDSSKFDIECEDNNTTTVTLKRATGLEDDTKNHCYYTLEFQRSCQIYEENSDGVFKLQEPLNHSIIVVIASNEPMFFKPYNNSELTGQKILPFKVNIESVCLEENKYYYQIEISPSCSRYLEFDDTYCYHDLASRFGIKFSSKSRENFSFSACIEIADISWWEPYTKDTTYDLTGGIQEDATGPYLKLTRVASANYEGTALITYLEDDQEKTGVFEVKLTSNRSNARLTGNEPSWGEEWTAKKLEIKIDPWTNKSIYVL